MGHEQDSAKTFDSYLHAMSIILTLHLALSIRTISGLECSITVSV